MRKFVLGALLLLSINTFSQTKDKPIFSGGLTFANYNIDTRKSPNFGVGVAFTLWNVYFDITSNWVNGAGEYLEYQSDSSYDTGKTNVVSGNLGYSFQLPKNFILTPYCGMVATTDIWEDPILNTTNFAVKRETKFNVGGLIQYEPIHPLNIYFGYANYEGVKFGVIIDFTPKSKN